MKRGFMNWQSELGKIKEHIHKPVFAMYEI